MIEVMPATPTEPRVPWHGADLALGGAVTAFGLVEAWSRTHVDGGPALPRYAIALTIGGSVLLHRRDPGVALALAWLACAIQILVGYDIMLVQLAVVMAAYGTARFGSPPIVWASAASIPLALLIGAAYVVQHGTELAYTLGLADLAEGNTRPTLVLLGCAAVPLVVPWLLGVTLRYRDQVVAARVESRQADERTSLAEGRRAQAEAIASLREEQARLARDVHDVVGHSLAVILAQAESGRFIPGDDPDRLKKVMQDIADAARTSLGEVREVLSATQRDAGAASAPGWDSLIEGVRSSGTPVESTVIGIPVDLPPDQAVAAYRVLQEMLTNALKHGRSGAPVWVTREWGDGLRIEVVNVIGLSQSSAGSGLDGMRRRMESVGGNFSVTSDAEHFFARAWLPGRPA
jgi:signal transduction histidine kinase